MPKYTLVITSSFKKDYKKLMKRHYDLDLLEQIVNMLINGTLLPEKNKDHS